MTGYQIISTATLLGSVGLTVLIAMLVQRAAGPIVSALRGDTAVRTRNSLPAMRPIALA